MTSRSRSERDLVGYARVSTTDQDPALQLDALHEAGCVRVFVDHASGTRSDRPELHAALDYLRAGDTLCVWRLDRLGRSLPHLIEVVASLHEREVEFRSLQEAIDTRTPAGRLFFHISGAFAQFERDLIVDRTRAGLAAARARGSRPGRKPALSPEKAQAVHRLHSAGDVSVSGIAAIMGVSRATVYRALAASAGDDSTKTTADGDTPSAQRTAARTQG